MLAKLGVQVPISDLFSDRGLQLLAATCLRAPTLESVPDASRSRYIRTARSTNSLSYLRAAPMTRVSLAESPPPGDPVRFRVHRTFASTSALVLVLVLVLVGMVCGVV